MRNILCSVYDENIGLAKSIKGVEKRADIHYSLQS